MNTPSIDWGDLWNGLNAVGDFDDDVSDDDMADDSDDEVSNHQEEGEREDEDDDLMIMTPAMPSVELVVPRNDEKLAHISKSESSRKKSRFNCMERYTARVLHASYVVLRCTRESWRNQWCNDVRLWKAMWSMVPADIRNIADVCHLVKSLLHWFRESFTYDRHLVLWTSCENPMSCVTRQLLDVVKSQVGGADHLVMLFVALCRMCRLRTRYVVPFLSPSITPDPSSVEKPVNIFLNRSCPLKRPLISYSRPCWCSDPLNGRLRDEGDDEEELDESTVSEFEHDDVCDVCRAEQGLLVCCSWCPRALHLDCAKPPLTKVPRGDWFCDQCVKRKTVKKRKKQQQKSSNKKKRKANVSSVAVPTSWCEILVGDQWVCVDVVNNTVYEHKAPEFDGKCVMYAPRSDHTLSNQPFKLSYVVAFDSVVLVDDRSSHERHLKAVVDVSRRYCRNPARLKRGRLKQEKLSRYMAYITNMTCASRASDTIANRRSRLFMHPRDEEKMEVARLIVGEHQHVNARSYMKCLRAETKALAEKRLVLDDEESIPNTVGALKNHPRYCIERDCLKFEIIYPKGPQYVVGVVGGKIKHDVYPRSHCHTLHTRDRWLRECRQVRADENCMKVVKKRKTRADQLEVGTTELFGIWQTEEWTPPPAKNGIVPTSERGNVELWTPKHLPKGTTHLCQPRVAMAARALNVDYAPAVTGFEIRGRRSVPKIEGIVVCSEFVDAVVTVWEEQEYVRAEKEERKRADRVRDSWLQLAKSIVFRHQIQEKYANQ